MKANEIKRLTDKLKGHEARHQEIKGELKQVLNQLADIGITENVDTVAWMEAAEKTKAKLEKEMNTKLEEASSLVEEYEDAISE